MKAVVFCIVFVFFLGGEEKAHNTSLTSSRDRFRAGISALRPKKHGIQSAVNAVFINVYALCDFMSAGFCRPSFVSNKLQMVKNACQAGTSITLNCSLCIIAEMGNMAGFLFVKSEKQACFLSLLVIVSI